MFVSKMFLVSLNVKLELNVALDLVVGRHRTGLVGRLVVSRWQFVLRRRVFLFGSARRSRLEIKISDILIMIESNTSVLLFNAVCNGQLI